VEIEKLRLHENKGDFRAAVSAAAKELSLPEHIVEKDYWVTKLLFNLSQYTFKEYVVFKGGTSLSKGHKIINRFSEDVDLALHPDGVAEDLIDRRAGNALYKIICDIRDPLFTDDNEGKQSEARRYKRIYQFPQVFQYPEHSIIHGKIVLEINCFAAPFPAEEVEISSLIADYLIAKERSDAVSDLGMGPFGIKTLSPERSFCEKLLALRRANCKGGEFFEQRIRHVYDIHYLFRSQRIQDWLDKNQSLQEMLRMCHAEDEMNQRISHDVASNFIYFNIFLNPKKEMERYRMSYERLKDITFDGVVPSIEAVSSTLSQISSMLDGFDFH
jgi:predicted nucleotidyltransferase component of viral defense system